MYKNTARIWPKRRFIASCQHFAITIASGSTAGTATINAVDPTRAFIVWGGVRSNAGVTARALATAVLTNSTTVTATRNSGTGSTCTVRGTVVEATGYLVKSVQSGTITLSAATSGTATINAVDTSRSVVFFNGISTPASAATLLAALHGLALTNSTTVTATASSASSSVVAFTVVEFQPGAVESVQDITVTATNTNTTDTVSLAPDVQPELSALAYGGSQTSTNTLDAAQVRVAIAGPSSATHVRVTGSNTKHGVAGAVIKFAAGVIRAIQRGTAAIAAGTSANAAIAAVDTGRSWLAFLGNDAAAGQTQDQAFAAAYLADDHTVTAEVSTAGTANVNFEVVSFN